MRHVVIGASAAGVKAAGLLREYDPDATITVVSRDAEIYSRCMLHLKLAGERDDASLSFVDGGFFANRNIKWLGGENVVAVPADRDVLLLESGKEIPFERLLIASGASSFIPPVPGLREGRNVFALRNIGDVADLAGQARPGARAVVVGAGLVGIDAAVALLELGVETSLVEMAGRILSIQLDDYAALQYERRLVERGAAVIVGAKVESAVLDGGQVFAIRLADGRELPCDFCVVAAGVAPNIAFLEGSGVAPTENKRAIAVDRRCRTSRNGVYAAGDVTFLAPIWPEATRQAEVAAANMAGREASLPDRDWAWTNSMNYFGLPTVSYGHTSMADPSFVQDVYVDGDVYRKVIHKGGVIAGAIFQGDIDNCGAYLRLVRDGISFAGTGKPPLRLSYADFFCQAANGEFL